MSKITSPINATQTPLNNFDAADRSFRVAQGQNAQGQNAVLSNGMLNPGESSVAPTEVNLANQGVAAVVQGVAAAVQGAPATILGETVCEWSIVKSSQPLTLNERVTRLLRDASRGDFCFNVVNNIKQGFDPQAELRVELKLLGKGESIGGASEPPLRRAEDLEPNPTQDENIQTETSGNSSVPGRG